jgi:hypothetical protein
MSEGQFRDAINSFKGFPKMVGFCGGEPLLHPHFEYFCNLALEVLPPEQLGLWTTFPKGYEHYREIICRTFYHIFLNDHTRDDVMHSPILVASKDVVGPENVFLATEHCWVQECWSACVNPKGAFFCEVAGHMAVLFDGPEGWPVEPGWWRRVTKDYAEQREKWCPMCGAALPLVRRPSTDGADDISQSNLALLQGISRKVKRGNYVLMTDFQQELGPRKEPAYKDMDYRDEISGRYGIYLLLNKYGFLRPKLK